MLAVDSDPEARWACQVNARANGVEFPILESLEALAEPVQLMILADFLYDPANLPLAERFLMLADAVLVADSRVPRFTVPGYREVAVGLGITEPDLGELDSVKQVRLYLGAGRGAGGVYC